MKLTGNKDTDFVILSQLDDRSLLNMCLIYKDNKACNDETFWKRRTINKYGNVKPQTSWKQYYLDQVYALGQELDQSVYDAARFDDWDEVSRLIGLGADRQYALDGAFYVNNDYLVNYINNL